MPIADIFFWHPLLWWWAPPVAVALDLCLGDPRRLPHPVQAIGRLLDWIAPYVLGVRQKKPAGGFAVIFVVAATCLSVAAGMALPHVIGLAFCVYWSWAGLALGSLLRAGKETLDVIKGGSLEEARCAVGMLVSRDVGNLEKEALYKALAETLSENMNDGVIAPFFWLVLGGPVALWAYKAVSTMDSTWGYKNDRWRDAGFACAKLDDILAYVPARLSAFFLFLLTIPLTGGKERAAWPGWKNIAAQAGKMESPNAGWPMAAAAWLENAPLGGVAVYGGKVKEKPLLGPEQGEWDDVRIARLIRDIRQASLIGLMLLWGMATGTAYLLERAFF